MYLFVFASCLLATVAAAPEGGWPYAQPQKVAGCEVLLDCLDAFTWELTTCPSPSGVPVKRTGKCIPPSYCDPVTLQCSQPGSPNGDCVFAQFCLDGETSALNTCPPSGPETTATKCAPDHSCDQATGACIPITWGTAWHES